MSRVNHRMYVSALHVFAHLARGGNFVQVFDADASPSLLWNSWVPPFALSHSVC